MKKVEFPIASYLLSAAIIGLGLAFFNMPDGYQSYRMQSNARNWPDTSGVVASSKIVESESRKPVYQPSVVTQYIVGGKEYVTHDIYYNQSSSWSNSNEYAFQMRSKYYPGKQVRVYYNPDDPYIAVLDIRVRWSTYIFMGVGGLFALLGMWMFYFSIKQTYLFVTQLLNKSEAN
ncbi:MAG: DUF3592 domain-containing protein [Chitinophagaceae bacterium]|nr:MAG: DUF3592 domain-containing protein [Chitinophagaceae bacterium]